jgi:hypothetical protein
MRGHNGRIAYLRLGDSHWQDTRYPPGCSASGLCERCEYHKTISSPPTVVPFYDTLGILSP